MGEVLGGAIVLVAVVVLLLGGVALATQLFRSSRGELETPRFRNHQAMARWIDGVLSDEMTRPLIPEDRLRAARRLLAEFYDEKELE